MQTTITKLKTFAWRGKNAFLEWLRYEKQLRNFRQEFQEYQKQNTNENFHLSDKNLYPCLNDRTEQTPVEPTYFYQDSWAFERIVKQHPRQHVDVGSNHKFVALLSKVVSVTMVDIRPLSLSLDTLNFKQGSITELPFKDGSVESLTSLCVVEHIGLGRYGDSFDSNGSEKAIIELCRVLAPNGHLYLSVPIGDQNLVAFNAGRIFSLDYLFQIIKPLTIIDQSFIVGNSLQKCYQNSGKFETTGLFELFKPKGA